MIELKIKELLEKYFQISNWETTKIYFGNNYEINSIVFEYENVNNLTSNVIAEEIKDSCNKYSKYYIEPEVRLFEKIISIKFRYFTRVK